MFSWFSNNGIKANPGKCHLLFSDKNNFKAKIDNYVIESSKQQKLLGVLLDSKLKFDKHLDNLCKKAS